MTRKNSKTQLRYEITTSRVTREKQQDCQSSTYNFSSRNKIKVT